MAARAGEREGARQTRTGIDVVDLARFRSALAGRPRLLERLFTAGERAQAFRRRDPVPFYAVRFAAKEAVGKLLGTGVLSWQEIEVVGVPPQVRLSGRTAAAAVGRGVGDIALSLSHSAEVAVASAVSCAEETAAGEGERVMRADILEVLDARRRPFAFTAEQMRTLDRRTIEELGLPGMLLMERAALGVSALVASRYPGRHTLVVCGRGNNGGDGLAASRQLHLAGHPVVCIVAADVAAQLSADAALNLRAAQAAGVNVRLGQVPDYLWEETEVVVDCLLGTGSTGEIRPPLEDWARRMTAAARRGVPVVAVDIPSGVDAGTGRVARDTVAADVTITFHAPKVGLLVPLGSQAVGELVIWDIGLPRFLEEPPPVRMVTAADVAVPGRRPDDHKYRAGYVAIVAGSMAYAGAAALAAGAAGRAGAGYVRLITSPSAAAVVRGSLPDVVISPVGAGDAVDDAAALLEAAGDERLGALVVGPGLGRAEATLAAARAVLLGTTVPAVVDADALLAFAGGPDDLRARTNLLLTPHAGELAALLGEDVTAIAAAHGEAARRGAQATGNVVLLKGSSPVIASPAGETWVVFQAPAQLASAGTGDVLSGLLGALLAKGLSPLEAAKTGAWLHAEAARAGVAAHRAGLRASDLLDLLPSVLSAHAPERRPSWTT